MTKAKLYTLMTTDWADALFPYFQTEAFRKLNQRILKDERIRPVLPTKENRFRVFKETALSDVKVVIIGQDPYHNVYYDDTPAAMGRAFACSGLNRAQPSLKNIVKELESDIDVTLGFDYTLQHWVDQGVFLLNTALTVRQSDAGSHASYWKEFTQLVMETLNKKDNLVFILWGNHAKSYKKYLTNKTHKFIESTHPSPFSAHNGFFGSKPFTKCNELLKEPIEWIDLHFSNNPVTPADSFVPYTEIEIIPPKTMKNERV